MHCDSKHHQKVSGKTVLTVGGLEQNNVFVTSDKFISVA